MKKTLIILLIPLLVFSTMSVFLTSLYCQGKLAEVGFKVYPCCDDVNKGGCCETKSVVLKHLDSFSEKRTDITAKLLNDGNVLIYHFALSDRLSTYCATPQINQSYKNTYLPPPHAYVLFCTFLL